MLAKIVSRRHGLGKKWGRERSCGKTLARPSEDRPDQGQPPQMYLPFQVLPTRVDQGRAKPVFEQAHEHLEVTALTVGFFGDRRGHQVAPAGEAREAVLGVSVEC